MSYFIQTTSVAWQRMAKVARAVGCDPARVSHGLLSLWFEWYETGDAEVTLGALKGHFGKDGIEDLVEALVDFEFLEDLHGGYRIRGTDRYNREGVNKRAEAGRKGGLRSAESRGQTPRRDDGTFGISTSPKQTPKQTPKPAEATPKQTPRAVAGTDDRVGTDSGLETLTEANTEANTEATEATPKQTPKQMRRGALADTKTSAEANTEARPKQTPKQPKQTPKPDRSHRSIDIDRDLSPKGEREISNYRASGESVRKPGPPPDGGQAAPAAKSYEQLVAEWEPCGLEPDPRHDWDGPRDSCGRKGHKGFKRATLHPDGVVEYHTCPGCRADAFEAVRKAKEAKDRQERWTASWDRRQQRQPPPKPPEGSPDREIMRWAIEQQNYLRWVETGIEGPPPDMARIDASLGVSA
jgi:hypothetical protein